jgi:tRNA A37 threonylcarbamoyltransferase TsaD
MRRPAGCPRAEEDVAQAALALQRMDEAADHADQFGGSGELLELGDLALAGGEQEGGSGSLRRSCQQQSMPSREGHGPPVNSPMIVLGIESSCDETGVALVEAAGTRVPVLRAHALHSQVDMHQAYGGVVPELASRDHIRRVLPLANRCCGIGCALRDVDVVAVHARARAWPALLVGAAWPARWARPRQAGAGRAPPGRPPAVALPQQDPPEFPFIALLVSGGHTQLMQVDGVGRYRLLGETIDDAAGEAFDKSAKLLGLGYPAARRCAAGGAGRSRRFKLPRPCCTAATSTSPSPA